MSDEDKQTEKEKSSIDWNAFAVQTISGAISGVISGLIVYVITR